MPRRLVKFCQRCSVLSLCQRQVSLSGPRQKYVCLTIEHTVGERGHARRTVKAELMLEPAIQNECMQIVNDSYAKTGSQIEKLERALRAVKDFLLKKSAARRKKDHKQIECITARLALLRKREAIKGPSDQMKRVSDELKSELYELTNPDPSNLRTARQSLAMAEGSDACTARYFKPYKNIAKKQWINEMKTADWTDGTPPTFTGSTSNPKEIPQALKSYYDMLYAEKTTDDAESETIFKQFRKRSIPKVLAQELDDKFQPSEVLDVLRHLHLGTQAGPDRLPNTFYYCLAEPLHEKLTDAFNEAVDRGALPRHMLEGDICLLYKKKERNDPRNYRPITLLNCSYKIYTRILARRLKKVVHLFISEAQKGFAPGAFIAECSMLTHLIEAWVNDEPLDRKGLMLFLDMEKAFDRCSFKYLNNALEALGFGTRFRRSIRMMYNENAPPRRRIYANGHYSNWFKIKSGVAQGCPLSPLLFLVVAEGLKIMIDAQGRSLLGIKVGSHYYKISQFADDTTLFLGSIKELKAAYAAIRRWCAATGMRENVDKREGLAMGNYRDPYRDPNVHLPADVNWVPEGDHVISLGVPVGNDLDATKWWTKKHEAVRGKVQSFHRLVNASYAGRNLIVQAMYFGSLRYWLFSLPMDKSVCTKVQHDADRMWWSKDPTLQQEEAARFRRHVSALTAIGPKNRGGVNNMVWAHHVTATQAYWAIRYNDPSEASWKSLWDYLLLEDHTVTRTTRFKFPEGRMAVLMPLDYPERVRLLKNVPKKATYLRACMRAIREVGLQYNPTDDTFIEGESPWHSHRLTIKAPRLNIRYVSSTLECFIFSDFIDDSTNAPFTKRTILPWIRNLHRKHHRKSLSLEEANQRANAFMRILQQIPPPLMNKVSVPYTRPPLKPHVPYAAVDGDTVTYFSVSPPTFPAAAAKVLWKDTRGVLNDTDDTIDTSNIKVFEVAPWASPKGPPRVRGLKKALVCQTSGWKLDGKDVAIDTLTISAMTTALQMRKFKPPPAETAWATRLCSPSNTVSLPFPKLWRTHSPFLTPRDLPTFFKVRQRNLYVGKLNPDPTKRRCLFCQKEENIQHLADCDVIFSTFWRVVLDLMNDFDIEDPDDCTAFILLGRVDNDNIANSIQTTFLTLAWRCLYATIVGERADDRKANLLSALSRFASMLHSRVDAYGLKWRNWSEKNTWSGNPHVIPHKHRDKGLVKHDGDGSYEISPILIDFHKARQEAAAAKRT